MKNDVHPSETFTVPTTSLNMLNLDSEIEQLHLPFTNLQLQHDDDTLSLAILPTSSSDIANHVLDIFTSVLPDHDQELFCQQCPLRCFTMFSRLPKELRLQIWTYSMPRGRLLKIREIPTLEAPTCHAAPPMTLFINRESRAESLSHYQLLFKDYTSLSDTFRRPTPIYFYPNADTIFFENQRFWTIAAQSRSLEEYGLNFNSIKSIRFEYYRPYSRRIPQRAPPRLDYFIGLSGNTLDLTARVPLRYFPNLERVVLHAARNYRGESSIKEEDVDAEKQILTGLFEDLKQYMPQFKVPEFEIILPGTKKPKIS